MNPTMTPSGVEQAGNHALRYLERASIEEAASRLRSEGYAVEHPEIGPDTGLDLIASKNGHKIAVQVKARPLLRDSAKQIGRTRDAARTRGFNEYRLVIVNPPHDREVAVEGLEDRLRRWIEEHPGKLDSIASKVSVKEVVNVDLSRVGVDRGRIRVAGVGTVIVESGQIAEEGRDGSSWTTDFPITFDVQLTHELSIESVEKMDIDLSSLDD